MALNRIGIVPVRAGSRGMPGKNTNLFAGVPLFMRAVRQGLRVVPKVLLSTDIPEVSQRDLPAGCLLRKRPPTLASDAAPMVDVLLDLIRGEQLQDCTVVLLQATSPLRLDDDIRKALELFEDGAHDLVMSVVRRPSQVLKYGVVSDGCFQPLLGARFCFENRQSLPNVYGPNGCIYVFSSARFLELGGFPSTRIGMIEMPPERSVSIDSADDFARAESLFRNSFIEAPE